METKRVVIVGAGVSGLAVCKHLLERGCRPVVFEADTVLGGVWARPPDCTQLQTERPMYQYSDFPWPESVTKMFPDHCQVAAYLDAYARHFGVLGCIRFGHRVIGMEYDGVKEEAVEMWGEWSGNGQAFGSGDGEWRLSVADAEGHVEPDLCRIVASNAGRLVAASSSGDLLRRRQPPPQTGSGGEVEAGLVGVAQAGGVLFLPTATSSLGPDPAVGSRPGDEAPSSL